MFRTSSLVSLRWLSSRSLTQRQPSLRCGFLSSKQYRTSLPHKLSPVIYSRASLTATPQLPPNPISNFHRAASSVNPLPIYEAPKNGVLSLLPKSWVPYAELMRIEKPGGLYGFYFPYLIGLSYAASITDPVISPGHLLSTAGLLFMWNVILRGAVCTINDNFDREYDRKVARCRLRPIARGAVTPVQGHIWYTAQAIVGLGFVSFLPHSMECMYHAVPIMLLLSIYPLAKRVTDFPQVVLCVPLAWGILMSCSALGIDPFTAQSNAIAAASACLMSSNALWLIMLDYVNACQDSLDDVKAGVRSMAVRYQNTGAFISVLGTAQVSLMVAAGYLAGMTPIYYVIACGGNAAMLVAMARTVSRARPDICAWWFLRGSILVGGTTVLGLLGEYMMKSRHVG